MVTEEMLEFIRTQRATGMSDDELTQLLITEGGWDKADIEEAYHALDGTTPAAAIPPQTIAPPSTPVVERAQEPVTPVLEPKPTPEPVQVLPPPVFSPPPPAPVFTPPPAPPLPVFTPPASVPLETPPVEKTAPSLDLGRILSGSATDHPLAQTKMSHDVLSGLLSGQGKEGDESKLSAPNHGVKIEVTREHLRDDSLAVVPPSLTPVASPPSSIETKKPQYSLDSLLVEKERAASHPSAPAPTKTADLFPASATTSSPSVPPGIKFDLSSALRATPSGPANISLPITSPNFAAEKARPAPPPPAFVPPPARSMPSASVTPEVRPTPTESAPPKEVEKKTPFTGKRTMMSDLLRKSEAVPAAPLSAPSTPSSERRSAERSEEPKPTPPASTPALFPDDETRRKRMKRMIIILVGTLLLLAVLGGGVFAFMKLRGADPETLLGTAFSRFFEVSAFTYKSETNVDLVLSGIPDHPREDGKIQFTLGLGGTLGSETDRYGDGAHKIHLNGGWQAGTSTFMTNTESDVLIVGNDFYFNILVLPHESELDPELLRANWIKVDLSEIARELQLPGVADGEEEYGSFGGTTGAASLKTLLEASPLFTGTEKPVMETLGGVEVLRTHVLADPDRLFEFIRSIYRRYMNQDLALSEEESLRLKGALAGVGGDIWTDAQTGDLVKIALAVDLDDDIGDTHVKGPIKIEFTFSDFNKPPLFGAPSPVLSLPELKTQMEESKALKALRARDNARVGNVTLIVEALDLYKSEKGRYPKELSELYGAKKLSASAIDLSALKDYVYRSYQKSGVFTKSGQCLTTGKTCAFYHLGTNLLDPRNASLVTDADQTTAILGADSAGCAGEADAYCYDVIAPSPIATSSAP